MYVLCENTRESATSSVPNEETGSVLAITDIHIAERRVRVQYMVDTVVMAVSGTGHSMRSGSSSREAEPSDESMGSPHTVGCVQMLADGVGHGSDECACSVGERRPRCRHRHRHRRAAGRGRGG